MNKLIQYVLQNQKLQPCKKEFDLHLQRNINTCSVATTGKCVGHIKTVINSSTWSYSFIPIHTCSLYILLPNIYISRVLVNTKSQTVKIDGLKSICI